MPDIRQIDTPEDLDELFATARQRPVWIFKHSLTCSISTAAWRQFQAFVEDQDDTALFTMVPIQKARPVSRAVAERTGVRHESPQALLVRGENVVWHGSHWDIDGAALGRAQEAVQDTSRSDAPPAAGH